MLEKENFFHLTCGFMNKKTLMKAELAEILLLRVVEISKELKDERIRLLEKKKQIDELRNSLETNLEYFEPEQEKLNKESYSEISAEISDETLNISLNCVKDNTVEDNQRREEEDQIEQKEQENI